MDGENELLMIILATQKSTVESIYVYTDPELRVALNTYDKYVTIYVGPLYYYHCISLSVYSSGVCSEKRVIHTFQGFYLTLNPQFRRWWKRQGLKWLNTIRRWAWFAKEYSQRQSKISSPVGQSEIGSELIREPGCFRYRISQHEKFGRFLIKYSSSVQELLFSGLSSIFIKFIEFLLAVSTDRSFYYFLS